jgi:hypothetical protein
MQAELDSRAAATPEASPNKQQAKRDSSVDTSSALWHELDVARADAASAKACAAEARANAESAASQLQQLASLHSGFLQDAQKLLYGTEDPQNDASCHNVLTQLERVLQQKGALEQRLSETRQRLCMEQESAVQVSCAHSHFPTFIRMIYPLHRCSKRSCDSA